MEDVAGQVASLRVRVEAAARARTAAEYARQQAEQTVKAAVAVLKEEFGVDAIEQAKEMLADFDRRIAAEVQKIEQALA